MSSSATAPQHTGDGTHRLFFALWPDDETRARIAATAARLRAVAPGGRWIPPERYHLTLQFLGTFPWLPAPVIKAALAAAAQVQSPAVTVTLDRVGIFLGRPQLWWLGREDPGTLLPLWQSLSRSLVAHGIRGSSAALLPHVTLARGMQRAPVHDEPLQPVDWEVRGFVLVHSHSAAQTTYTVLGRWPLQA